MSMYHPGGQELRPDVEALAASFDRLATFLERTHGGDPFFRRAAEVAMRAARDALPAQLPLVPGHGDYSPNNIFAHPCGRIAVFDTCGKWRVPLYEDVAFFLFTFKTLYPPMHSLSPGTRRDAFARYDGDFMRGYFGSETLPLQAVRAFEVQCVLAKWASRTLMLEGSRGVMRFAKRVRVAAQAVYLRRYAEETLRAIAKE
jgi:hypothetical protein